MININVNGQIRMIGDDVDPKTPLLCVLRDHLTLPAPKSGGAAPRAAVGTGRRDGKGGRSCQPRGGDAGKKPVGTIEGIGSTANGSKIQAAWMENSVPQCGYCQAGQIMSATALLNHTPN